MCIWPCFSSNHNVPLASKHAISLRARQALHYSETWPTKWPKVSSELGYSDHCCRKASVWYVPTEHKRANHCLSRDAAAQYAPKQRELLMTFGADDPCPSCTCTGHEYDKLDILRQLVLLACAQVLAVCSYDRINTDHLEDMAAGLGEDSSMPAGCL